MTLACITALSCGGSSQGSGGGPARPQVSAGSHVFVIVLENREFGQVIGSPSVPYINRLAHRGALATRYFAITHPSLPNYLAILGGSTFGIHSDCAGCSARGQNFALQLSRKGISWRAYMGAMPSKCFQGGFAGTYAKKHNPFLYFPSIRESSVNCANVVPGDELSGDLAAGDLPAFSWITPDLCQDAHDCGLSSSDRYLADLVPKLLSNLGPQGFLVLTFDEGVTNRGCCRNAHGGRVATIIVGPQVKRHARLKLAYDHYSLLRTLEDAFSVPAIRAARRARPIRAAFRSAPSLP